MASSSCVLIIALLSALATLSNAGGIAVYWGQYVNEGSLADACDSGLYSHVILSFLNVFGNGVPPVLNLAGHCVASLGTCTFLSTEIKKCQSQGIKVFLSLGGPVGLYSLSSPHDVASVAAYLWNNYLGGSSSSRPLGDAVLDGIDLDIDMGTPVYYGDLARSLIEFGNQTSTKVYLSAAPECPFPDYYLEPALHTVTFDYVWVRFYNNPICDDSSGISSVIDAWEKWTSGFPSSTLFLGIPAAIDAAESGYILPKDLTSWVLPSIHAASNYGGIMLWNRFYDVNSRYSAAVKSGV